MTLEAGQRFGNFEILRILGSGGMGEVYLAKDLRLSRQVAIKVLSPKLIEGPEVLARFRKEAGLAAVLNHPNICTIYETGEVNGRTYICMEHVEGRTLRDRIAGEPMPVSEVLDIAVQVADALEEARTRGIIHRDIKSLNILLTARGRVKVMDFGLAKQVRTLDGPDVSEDTTKSSLTHSGDVRGTPAYMSPEQALGKAVDHRSDIFSFGVVLYEMLAGRLPFTGSSITEVVDAILHKAPAPVTRYNEGVTPELTQILNKMLEKDPDMRYQSVHEVWVDLRRVRGETGAVRPPRFRALSISTVLVIFLGLAALLAGWLYLSRREPGDAMKAAAKKEEKVAIAVLPFRYVGEDPTRQYLGQLVTDALITGLQSAHGIAVAPYANVREVSATDPPAKVFQDLGVQWIVRGTVSAGEEKTEIRPEIVGKDGAALWNGTLSDRPIAALDLARRQILAALHLNPSPKEIEQLRTPNLDAYQTYLEARNREEGSDVEGNLDEAIRLYRVALQKDPDFASAHAGLAVALLRKFDQKKEAALLADAKNEAQRAFGLDPGLPEALVAYGKVQVESGNSIEGSDAFARALELAPGDDAACRNLADMYSMLGRNKDAETMYRQAVALRPSFWKNHYYLGLFMWQSAGDPNSARESLEKAVKLHPEGYAPLVMMGNISLTQGDLRDAEEYFRRALEQSPNAGAYSNLGLVYYYRRQYDLALRNWQAVLKEAPDNPVFQANVADALRQLKRVSEAKGRYLQAIDSLRAGLKMSPADDVMRVSLTMALAAIGQCNEASAEAKDVLSRHPAGSEFLAYAAITAGRCGDQNWAKQLALSSIATNNLLVIRFDPDLEPVRQLPDVKQALDRAVAAKASAQQ